MNEGTRMKTKALAVKHLYLHIKVSHNLSKRFSILRIKKPYQAHELFKNCYSLTKNTLHSNKRPHQDYLSILFLWHFNIDIPSDNTRISYCVTRSADCKRYLNSEHRWWKITLISYADTYSMSSADQNFFKERKFS